MKYTCNIPDIDSDFLMELLKIRGIQNIEAYIEPTEQNLLDWRGLDHMQEGVEMLQRHLNDKIGILGDSDCDGFTSAAIMYNYIKDLNPNANIVYYLHDGKGHGLEDTIQDISDDLDLLITPDSSTNDEEFHKILSQNGIDILVLDHHECDTTSQYACVINNQCSPQYENKELTGAGIAYKFCKAYDELNNTSFADIYIDLAAVGIVGDMSTILNPETRYIISQGLSHIHNTFITALIDKQSYSIGGKEITPMIISFYIVPLINAIIRIGTSVEKENVFKAFIDGDKVVKSTKRGAREEDTELLSEQAARICVNARSRQNRQKEKALDVLDMTIEKNDLNRNKIIVVPVEDDSINNTLTGLVAMSLVSKYKKPVLVGRYSEDGYLRGSGRCPDKTALTDFRQFLNQSELFTYAEGHAQAFGYEIDVKNLDKFTDYANEQLKDIDFYEGVYQVDFVKPANYSKLLHLVYDIGSAGELWTQGNNEPYIVLENIRLDKEDIHLMGANQDSVKFVINGVSIVKFKDHDFIDKLLSAQEISLTILGRANMNSYMGYTTPQIIIDDYELVDSFYDF